jgi:hypothetical protein
MKTPPPRFSTGQPDNGAIPHSYRTDSVTAQIQPAADYRTLSAQPHKPAQVFLPMPASRRKITVDIRGEAMYKG